MTRIAREMPRIMAQIRFVIEAHGARVASGGMRDATNFSECPETWYSSRVEVLLRGILRS